jgi:hypothetical protein
MLESEYGRNRSAILPGKSDVNFVAHAFNEVLEPHSRLREQMMPPPCNLEKAVKLIHKLL